MSPNTEFPPGRPMRLHAFGRDCYVKRVIVEDKTKEVVVWVVLPKEGVALNLSLAYARRVAA